MMNKTKTPRKLLNFDAARYLTDDAAVHYQVSEFHAPQAEWGARHDDPAFAIKWPVAVLYLSDKDRGWPDFVRLENPDQLWPELSEAPKENNS